MMTLLHVISGVITLLSGSDGTAHGSAGRVGGSSRVFVSIFGDVTMHASGTRMRARMVDDFGSRPGGRASREGHETPYGEQEGMAIDSLG